MPRSIPIPAPLQKALIECFRAIARLVRPELQREGVLVGGAASVAHNSVYYTEDVDVAAPENVLLDIWVGVTAGTPEFTMVPDGTVCFNARQGFPVQIDLIQIGDGPIDRIYNAEPFYEGSVASVSDLLRLRAMSYVDRGKSGDDVDFKWLLWEVASGGQILPELDNEERAYVAEAGNSLLGRADRLGLLAVRVRKMQLWFLIRWKHKNPFLLSFERQDIALFVANSSGIKYSEPVSFDKYENIWSLVDSAGCMGL